MSRVRRPAVLAVLSSAVLALVVSVVAVGVPSITYDESATRIAVRLSDSEFLAMIREIDLVHAAYYVALRGWAAVFGDALPSLRLMSGVAVAAAAGLTAAIGVLLRGPWTGLASGVVFALLPVVIDMGSEARPRALSCAVVAAAVVAFLAADRRSGKTATALWGVYAALSAIAVVTNVHNALVLVALAVTATVSFAQGTLSRRSFWLWATASLVATVVVAPFVAATARQVSQVAWIEQVGLVQAALLVASDQWFGRSVAAIAGGWLCILLAVVRRRTGGPHRTRRITGRRRAGSRVRYGHDLVLLLPWAVVPTLVLLLSDLTAHPMYTPRYTSMSAPAVALLIVYGASSVRPLLRTLLVVTVVVGCATSWWQQRFEPARADWRSAAAAVERTRYDHPGRTAVVYGTTLRRPEHLADDSPAAVDGVTDLTALPTKRTGTGWFFVDRSPIRTVGPRAASFDTVIWVGDADAEERELVHALADQGFREVERQPFDAGQDEDGVVATFTR